MTEKNLPSPVPDRRRLGFFDDFKRFFVRGLAAVLPTLITLWLLVWVWDFLWNNVGDYIIESIRRVWYYAGDHGWVEFQTRNYILQRIKEDDFKTHLIGVGLAILLIYIIGVFVGNLIGRTFWRIAERAVLRIPFIRAIYPAVKQVTDFLLAERSRTFEHSRVVAVQPHAQGIWSVGLVTNSGPWNLGDDRSTEMVTVFIPSTPTSFSGYVLVVPRKSVVELPMSVEQAMRLLVSGGVITPSPEQTSGKPLTISPDPPDSIPESLPSSSSVVSSADRGSIPKPVFNPSLPTRSPVE